MKHILLLENRRHSRIWFLLWLLLLALSFVVSGCDSNGDKWQTDLVPLEYPVRWGCADCPEDLVHAIRGVDTPPAIDIYFSYGDTMDTDHQHPFTYLGKSRYAVLVPLYEGFLRFQLSVFPFQFSGLPPTEIVFVEGESQTLESFSKEVSYTFSFDAADGVYQFLLDDFDETAPTLTITRRPDIGLCSTMAGKEETAEFIESLYENGFVSVATVPTDWWYDSPSFSVPEISIHARGEDISVWEYPSKRLLDMDKKKILEFETDSSDPLSSPRYYSNDHLIVLNGSSPSAVSALIEEMFGDPFAGDFHPNFIRPQCESLPDDSDLFVDINDRITADRGQYITDLTFIAQPRPIGSDHHAAVQELCADRFRSLGFEVESHEYGSGINVIGVKLGRKTPDRRVLVSAHYDHIPSCPGADDNGSGVAGVLETARMLSSVNNEKTLIVACWDEEEAGMVGSREYARRESEAGRTIDVAYVYEMIGYKNDEPGTQNIPDTLVMLYPQEAAKIAENDYRGDFILIAHDDKALRSGLFLSRIAQTMALSLITLEVPCIDKSSTILSNLQRSDHSVFWDLDIPALMITDTANFRNPYYHCGEGEDTIDTLDMDFAVEVVEVVTQAVYNALISQ